MTDAELLRQYAFDRSQTAFAQLVRRHVDLVHSAAWRQVRSAQLAEDVAQSVFLELARQAGRVRADESLAAWLYVITRRKAVDVIRRETRRLRREQVAWEVSAMKTTPAVWAEMEPWLDEAMAGLEREDQRAVVLRFFENKSFREIGSAVGSSEDAAQKRVSRALERLRSFYAKKGVAATAAGLATEIAAHAVQAAPAGLAGSISQGVTASVAVGAHGLGFLSGKSLAMTFTQKILVTSVIVAAIGGAVLESRALATERAAIDRLTKQLADVERTNQQFATERDQDKAESDRIALAKASAGPATEAQILSRSIARLKERVANDPRLVTPEFQFLTDDDWILAVEPFGELKSDQDFRHVLATLRADAAREFEVKIGAALKKYFAANGNKMPTDVSQLIPFFDTGIDPGAFGRYQLSAKGKFSDGPNWTVSSIPGAAVDPAFDQIVATHSGGGYGSEPVKGHELRPAIQKAFQVYQKANGVIPPTNESDVLPYFENAADADKFRALLKSRSE